MTGLPSCQRACGRSVKVTDERSGGVSTFSASSPYSLKGSSADATRRVSQIRDRPAAGLPRTRNGLKLSNVPTAAWRTRPPLGAFGFT